MNKVYLAFAFVLACASSKAQNHQDVSDFYSMNNDTVKRVKKIEPVVIQSIKQGKTISDGKSSIKPIDLPQGIQIIDSKIIEQQQSLRLSDVIKNANGVYLGSARGGAQETFWSRGYDMSANNMLKNGFRINSGSMPEVTSLEQVELLKGGSALLFGNVTPGGILNMVTKTPQFNFGGNVSFQAGSYNFYKPTLDIYGPLNDKIAYRMIASYEDSESFRDVVTRKRLYFNPSVLFKVTDKTTIILQGDYLRDNWTPDFGTGAIGKELVDLPRNTYLGARNSNGLTTQATFTGQINHKFNENWKLNSNTSFQDYTRLWEGTERIIPDTNGNLKRPYGKNDTGETILGQQFNLQGNFATGSIKHQFASGIDLDQSYLYNNTHVFTPTSYDSTPINIFDPSSYAEDHEFASSRNTLIAKTETLRLGFYIQDLISITNKFKILAGLRWSWQESQLTNYKEEFASSIQTIAPENAVGEETPIRINKAFSPKIGLIYQPFKNSSIFASYSNSFTPNTGTDIEGNVLEASIIDQIEFGIKKGFWNNRLHTNITLYQIVNSNLAQTAPNKLDGSVNTDTTKKILSGETTSKGIELDATYQLNESISILAGYSYNDMRFTKTNGVVAGSFIEGDRVARTPQHTANASAFYTIQSGILKGFSVGFNGNYIGDRIGGWNNDYAIVNNVLTFRDREIPVKGYTTIDTSVGYAWKSISILCKVSNLTNELNYTVHENYSINPIAPRQVLATLKYKF